MTAKEIKQKNAAADERKSQMAEDLFQKMMDQGKVNPGNIRKIKEQIAKKTGAYPLGATN
jgi:ribosomal protein L29